MLGQPEIQDVRCLTSALQPPAARRCPQAAPGRRAAAPNQHADFVTPWDLSELLRVVPDRVDVMLEAKAKDLAVLWLRKQFVRVLPQAGTAEELRADATGAAAHEG